MAINQPFGGRVSRTDTESRAAVVCDSRNTLDTEVNVLQANFMLAQIERSTADDREHFVALLFHLSWRGALEVEAEEWLRRAVELDPRYRVSVERLRSGK